MVDRDSLNCGTNMLIAEIGINHNGELSKAFQLINAAKIAGWDVVKFQKRNSDKCVPEHHKHTIRDTIFGKMSYLEYRNKMEFGKEEFDAIDTTCRSLGIRWTASAFDTDSYEFLKQYALPWIKIPSCSLTDKELLAAVDGPVIISTGMSTIEQIMQAVAMLGDKIVGIAHCTSAYPCPPSECNLNMIWTLKGLFPKIQIGYSGHESGITESIAAAALGAEFIERHVTLDRTMKGSDHAASLEIQGMVKLRKAIDTVRLALGDGVKRVYESEQPLIDKLRVHK